MVYKAESLYALPVIDLARLVVLVLESKTKISEAKTILNLLVHLSYFIVNL